MAGAADFATGRMRTQLDGVSVTVNGKSAFVYYISPAPVNVLTRPDVLTGPVEVASGEFLKSGRYASVGPGEYITAKV